MITEALIAKLEIKTANYRVDAINRLGKGVPLIYVQSFLNGCDGVEEIYQAMMQDQLRINERKNKGKKKIRWFIKPKGGKKK